MRSIRLKSAVFVGALAALLLGAILSASSAHARSFDAVDETVTKAKLLGADDDRPTFEKRRGPKPKRPKQSKPDKPSWADSGKGGGPPSWAGAFGRREALTFDISSLGRSVDRDNDRDGRVDTSNSASSATFDAAFIWPVQGRRLTTKFSRRHDGIDIGVAYSPVSAAAAGQVVFAGGRSCCGYGRYVEVLHADGYLTRYAHLSRVSVRVGDRVDQGELLGISGDTGRSTGPHLHFELRHNGSPVDPLRYLP